MASKTSPLLQTIHLPRAQTTRLTPRATYAPKRVPQPNSCGRRECLFVLTALTATREFPSLAEDIPLFGLRKKLRKAEEEAEEILREGERAVEKGLETAEKGIETAGKEIATVEREIETVERGIGAIGGFAVAGDLGQAGVVVGAEAVGVLFAASIVNGILGPEARKT